LWFVYRKHNNDLYLDLFAIDVEWAKYCEDDDPIFIRMNVRNIKTLLPFQLHDPVRVATRTKAGDNKIGGDGIISKINHGIVLHLYKSLSPPPIENCHSFLIFNLQMAQHIQCSM
jgi:hypothetical protein